MITLTLVCDQQHQTQSRFKDIDSFDRLQKAGLLQCTVCGSLNVSRGLSSPNVQAKGNQLKTTKAPVVQQNVQQKLEQKIAQFKAKIKETHEDVGDQFPEIARAIHYNEQEQRDIIGTASPKEANDLVDEGINIMPLPFIPDRQKN